MSSEDVIELGSSDEDTEPARKRRKPLPDAMVCFPSKFHDVAIKPVPPDPAAIAGLGNAITVKKINKQPAKIKLTKGKPAQSKPKFNLNPVATHPRAALVQNITTFSKVPILRPGKIGNSKSLYVKPSTFLQKAIQIQPSGPLNLLPPSITVKKTKSNVPIVKLNINTKEKMNKRNAGEILTLELDDDEVPAHKSSPQWYLRPEDQIESCAMEEENNKEPEISNLIEITVEDSPVKPVINKQIHAVEAELAITIDDSPIKIVEEKNRSASESENEYDSITTGTKMPCSKKQLVYPNETENSKTVEIEINPCEINNKNCSDLKDQENKPIGDDKLNNYNSKDESLNASTEKIIIPLPFKEESMNETQNSDLKEFHPVYQSFIELCFQLENSDDMKTIVDKKIKGYYKQVPKEYTESEAFTDMVSSKILSMKAGPEKMYLYIKDIVDELNLQRKLAKAQSVVLEKKLEEPEPVYVEDNEYDSKRQRQIRKLEKTIKKLHRAIQKLEEQEIDFDDEDDSVYLLTERYKERLVRVYAKFCQLSNTKMPSEPRIQLDARPGRPSGPAKRLEKMINKKVPIGTPLPFPDFHDVLRCVKDANEEDRLGFNDVDIMEEARDLFIRCGRKLQRRRQENEWRLAASRITVEKDPAEDDENLKQKLNENRKVAAQKETEIFNKYADRQNQLKLEAEEIGDKEAEESPVESEEDEVNDENASLENTEKRKERLKRLLQEKSKKTADEKDSQICLEDQNKENNKDTETTMEVDPSATASTPQGEDIERTDKQGITKIDDNSSRENTDQQATETFTLSDDSNELESDIDELHLLQKLHSGNEDQTSSYSSDSESSEGVLDLLESNDSGKNDVADVISIENSSYSENEDDKVEDSPCNPGSVQYINEDSPNNHESVVANIPDENVMNVDLNSPEVAQTIAKAPPKTNNDECDEAVENILLASSEDSNTCDSQGEITDTVCVNLRDDLISIDETVVGNVNNEAVTETITVTASPDEIQSENNVTKVNIDSDVMCTTHAEEIEMIIEQNSDTQPDAIKNNGVVVLDEIAKTNVESMNVDEVMTTQGSDILANSQHDASISIL